MRRSSTAALSVIAVALAVVLAGCGGTKYSSSAKSSEGGGKEGGGSGGAYSYGEKGSQSTSAAAGGPMTVTTKSNSTLGTILAAGPKKLTVYMFEADHGNSSSCYGACATSWPPVTTSGSPKAEGGVMSSKLSTITRKEGTKQLSYAGHPLYYYAGDASESEVTGQGLTSFGAPWYVLSPGGEVVKKK